MQLVITTRTINGAGKFLDRTNNPIVKAVNATLPYLTNVTAHQNRVVATDTAGRRVRFVLRPAFSPREYRDLVTEKSTSVTCSLEPVAVPTDHDIE